MAEHQDIVDAFTDTPQAEAMAPKPKADEDAGTDDTPIEDLSVQGGE